MAAACVSLPLGATSVGPSMVVTAGGAMYHAHSSDEEHAMSVVVDGDGDGDDAANGLHHDESGSHTGSADLTTSEDDGGDVIDSLPPHVSVAGVTDQLRHLCRVMHESIPHMQQNTVYEVSKWINYPVQVLVSDLHRPSDDFARYYMSTRSIGEYVLHLLSANMTVKTNITTTIVRKFKAVNPDLSKYGLLVKTLGQKPEKSFLVQTIPVQSEQVSAAGKGRGSHQNSRGTSYYWPFWQIPRIVQPLIHTIRRSKAFRDIQYIPGGVAPAVAPTLAHVPVAPQSQQQNVCRTPPRTPQRLSADGARGSARKKSRSISMSSDEGAPTVPAGLASPVVISANSRTRTTPRSKKQRDRSPENKPDIRVQFAPRVTGRRGRDESDSDDRSDCEDEFLRGGRAVPATAPPSNASSVFARSADAAMFSLPNAAMTTTRTTACPMTFAGLSPASHRRQPSTSEDSGLGSGPDDCKKAVASMMRSNGWARDLAREAEIARSIELKRAKIEEYNNILVGLLFEVAQEEQMLRQIRGEA